MTKTFKLALAAALAAPMAALPVAASAQAATAQSIAIADLDEAVANSNANRVAASQRPVTYKAAIDQYQARGAQLQTQISGMIAKLQRDAQAPNANQQALAQQEAAIKQLQASGQQEVNTIIRPVALSEAYVAEQIGDKLDQAVTNAMTKAKVTILLAPQAVLARQNANVLTQAITNELNTLISSANLVPPAGWEPRQLREARAAQAQQQGQAAPAPAAPAATAPAATTPRPGQPQRNN